MSEPLRALGTMLQASAKPPAPKLDDWDLQARVFERLLSQLSREDRINVLASKFRLIAAMGDMAREVDRE